MRAIAVVAAATLLSGCASLFSESKYQVQVTSSPPGADFEIKDRYGKTVYDGTTPATVRLDAGAKYFRGQNYFITYRKEGYNTGTSEIDSGIDGWYWPNILIGGILGMLIIDPLTGAMYDLPSNTSATLSLASPPAQPVSSSYGAAAPSKAQWQQQQLLQLQGQPMSYEEYQRRYQQIMSQ